MTIRKTLAALLLATVVPVAAACGTTADAASTTSSSTVTTDTGTGSVQDGGARGGGPGGVEVSSVSTALVEAWSPAIDDLLAGGEITEAEAEQYRAALEEAFTFRVNWDGEEATPTLSGLSA